PPEGVAARDHLLRDERPARVARRRLSGEGEGAWLPRRTLHGAGPTARLLQPPAVDRGDAAPGGPVPDEARLPQGRADDHGPRESEAVRGRSEKVKGRPSMKRIAVLLALALPATAAP